MFYAATVYTTCSLAYICISQVPHRAPFCWLEGPAPAKAIPHMARQYLGATPRRWMEYLAAILIGNAIYYFSLFPHLPGTLRHQGFGTDWGAGVDFLVCVGVYGLIRVGSRIQARR
jgi:hypothetical protein